MEHDRDNEEFGYREKLRVGDQVVVIDSWSLMARIDIVKSVLGGGFPVHFNENPTVAELLDSPDTEDLPSQGLSGSDTKRSKKIRR